MIGTRVEGFEIRERLGAGGMGVVYAAWDPELKRMVALKALPESARDDPVLWRRLRREAEAAAALTHPAICQIHRFLGDANPPALVLELVSGPTLAERIAEGPLPVAEAIRIVRRVAEGLGEAHDRKVVHRDIKPSNILLTRDGRPKLTDFGLAILPEATRLTLVPSPMGTVPYMSPEQIAGEQPTPRMDVWSLGVVTYELLTGQRPFRGAMPEAIFLEIQTVDPVPVHELRPEVPDAISAIVGRCLERDPEDRYPDCGALAHDLFTVEQSLLSGSVPTGTLPEWKRPRRWRRPRALALASSVALIAALVAAGFWLFPPGPDLPDYTVSRVTSNPWWEGEPSLSPDGQRVAYAAATDDNFDVYICATGGGRPFRLTESPADDRSPVWHPDGTTLYFVSNRSGDVAIWRIGQYGGDAALVVPLADHPAISPDGQWLAYSGTDEAGESRIGVAPLAAPGEARLITGEGDGLMAHFDPAWAPDSRRICYSAYDGLWTVDRTGVDAVRLETGSDFVTDPVWAPDGLHIYFSEADGQSARIARIEVNRGRVEPVTLGTGPERHPTLSRDGGRLVYSTQTSDRELVFRRLDTGEEFRMQSASDFMPALVPDASRMVFVSDRWGGTSDLWVQDLHDGRPSGEPRLLLDHELRCSMPEVSPDGRRVAFYVIDGEYRHLMVTRLDGGETIQLTDGPFNDSQPTWAPDGSELLFISDDRGGAFGLWRLGVSGSGAVGEPRQVDTAGRDLYMPRWSPSGKRFAGIAIENGALDLWVVDLETGPRRLTRGASVRRFRWGADDERILAVGLWGGVHLQLRAVDTASGTEQGLTPAVGFEATNEDPSFEYCPQGNLLVYSDVESSGDLWLLETVPGGF